MDQTDQPNKTDQTLSDQSVIILNEIARNANETTTEAISKILEIARSVDAVDLFVALFANMALGPAEHVSEATHGTVPAKLELFAYYIYPLFGKSGARPLTPWDTQLCWDALDKLFVSRMHLRMFSERKPDINGEVDDFGQYVRMHTEIVRGSAYPEQTKEEILSVQGKFDTWFARQAGIAPSRGIDVLWGITNQIEEAANDCMSELYDSMRIFRVFWQTAKRKRPEQRSEPEKQVLDFCADEKTAKIFGYVKRLNELAPLRLPFNHTAFESLHPAVSEKNGWLSLI